MMMIAEMILLLFYGCDDEYRNKYVGSLSYLNIVHIYTQSSTYDVKIYFKLLSREKPQVVKISKTKSCGRVYYINLNYCQYHLVNKPFITIIIPYLLFAYALSIFKIVIIVVFSDAQRRLVKVPVPVVQYTLTSITGSQHVVHSGQAYNFIKLMTIFNIHHNATVIILRLHWYGVTLLVNSYFWKISVGVPVRCAFASYQRVLPTISLDSPIQTNPITFQ